MLRQVENYNDGEKGLSSQEQCCGLDLCDCNKNAKSDMPLTDMSENNIPPSKNQSSSDIPTRRVDTEECENTPNVVRNPLRKNVSSNSTHTHEASPEEVKTSMPRLPTVAMNEQANNDFKKCKHDATEGSSQRATPSSPKSAEATAKDAATKRKSAREARDAGATRKPGGVRVPNYGVVGDLMGVWQKRSSEHVDRQRLNPFSGEFDFEHAMAVRVRKGQEGYGRPQEDTATAERGRRAQRHVLREIEEMVLIIREVGVRGGADGRARVTFGRLFDRYVRVSDKVVGILLRARKHGHVHFEGEMLWQGQDDDVVITLLSN